jgi:hypothetical protein
MLCLTCSIDMQLIQSDKDASVLVEGFKHQTWRCGSCGEVEQRTVFTHARAPVETVLDARLDVCARPDALRAPERAWRRAIERLHQHQEFLKQRSEALRRAGRGATCEMACRLQSSLGGLDLVTRRATVLVNASSAFDNGREALLAGPHEP